MLRTILALTWLLAGTAAFARQPALTDTSGMPVRMQHAVHLGYNIGAVTPLSMPENIRKIENYAPGLGLSLGYEFTYRFNARFGLATGVRLDWKSMRIEDSVQYFHTVISMDNAEMEGDFTGRNATRCRNIYLGIPVQAVYHASEKWQLKAGLYMAYLLRPSFEGEVSDGYLRKGNSLGEKINIPTASFNFDDQLQKVDAGLIAGAAYNFCNRMAVIGDIQWGWVPVFPTAFKGMNFSMYNLFLNIGVSYRL